MIATVNIDLQSYSLLLCGLFYEAICFILTLCQFVLVFFSPFSIAITSLGEERANLSAFRTFVRFVLVWICRFLLPLGVWEGLRFVIVALPGLFCYFLFTIATTWNNNCAKIERLTEITPAQCDINS